MTTFIFDDIAAKTESRLNLVRIKAESVMEFLTLKILICLKALESLSEALIPYHPMFLEH